MNTPAQPLAWKVSARWSADMIRPGSTITRDDDFTTEVEARAVAELDRACRKPGVDFTCCVTPVYSTFEP